MATYQMGPGSGVSVTVTSELAARALARYLDSSTVRREGPAFAPADRWNVDGQVQNGRHLGSFLVNLDRFSDEVVSINTHQHITRVGE